MIGWSQAVFVLVVLVAVHVPLGDYMALNLDGGRHLKAERLIYRVCGVDPDSEQNWRHYLAALTAFSVMSILALFALFSVSESTIMQYNGISWVMYTATTAKLFEWRGLVGTPVPRARAIKLFPDD